jgi:hypothetical protein
MFKVKCPVIARDSGFDIDSFVLTRSKSWKSRVVGKKVKALKIK